MLQIDLNKNTAIIWEYKVGNNANIANFLRLWKTWVIEARMNHPPFNTDNIPLEKQCSVPIKWTKSLHALSLFNRQMVDKELLYWSQGCARFAVFLPKYFEFQILWSLSSVDFFLSQSNSQFQLDFNLRFVLVLDTLPSQWCRNIFLKIDF